MNMLSDHHDKTVEVFIHVYETCIYIYINMYIYMCGEMYSPPKHF